MRRVSSRRASASSASASAAFSHESAVGPFDSLQRQTHLQQHDDYPARRELSRWPRLSARESLDNSAEDVRSALDRATALGLSRRKGELTFKANFESGNLSKVHVIREGSEYELFIRPDTNNPRYRLWFYFSVRNARKNRRVLFTIVNFSKTRSLYRRGMTPLVRCESLTGGGHGGRRTNWERLPERSVFYYRSARHRRNYVLSFVFTFDREDDVYYFSYCYPYTYTNLQRFLYHIDRRNLAFYKRELMGRTVRRRRLDLLTITSVANAAALRLRPGRPPPLVRRKAVVFTARVHPGESPASFICHGIISFLISDHPRAKLLRELFVFKVVPMLNPDGVFLGNYRCSSTGFDLNRRFLHPLDWAHPEVVATRNMLMELRDSSVVDLDYYIDIHSHSTARGGFVYISRFDDPVLREESLLYPRLLDYRAKEFSFNDSKTCKDPSKRGTGRRALGETLKIAKHCYTFEISFSSYVDNSRIVPFTEEAYLNLGRNMCLAFLDLSEALKSKQAAAVAAQPAW